MNQDHWNGQAVLVVDDSSTARALLRHLFRAAPIALEIVASAGEFMERISYQAYDLVLLDYRLPDGDGLDLLAECRQRCPRAAVVLITGKADTQTATEALLRGADGYLDKRHLKDGSVNFLLALKKAVFHRQRMLAENQLQSLREEFHAVVTHDLRAPAASASVALRMFKDSRDEATLDTALASLDRFFERLDRYQDYIRMGATGWQLEANHHFLHEVVEEVVQSLQPLANRKGQQLVCELQPAAGVFDAQWLGQAVENLLGNAIKYTQEGGMIWVRTGGLWVEVSDNGPGVPEELRPTLFQPYFRADTRAGRGSGLGLSIVQQVAAAHRGQVTIATGANGRGLTLRLSWPANL